MTERLFRQEVYEAKQDRLLGEVILTQPRSSKVASAAVAASLVLAFVWLSAGTYARIETVPGTLVTDAATAKIIAPQPGIVTALKVAEGDSVRKGDALLFVASDILSAQGDAVGEKKLTAVQARLELLREQADVQRARSQAEQEAIAGRVAAAKAEAASLREQITLQREVVQSNTQMYEQAAKVAERGFVSTLELERRRQTLLMSRKELVDLNQRLNASTSRIAEGTAQLESSRLSSQDAALGVLGDLEALDAERAIVEGDRQFVLEAPFDGRVTAIATGLGLRVSPDAPAMTLIPQNTGLIAELYAPSRAIGFVEPDMEVRLLYDAFPYERFGSFPGTVVSVSRVAILPSEARLPIASNEPVYRVRVRLGKQSGSSGVALPPVQAGMTLRANIVLERQSFLEWLLQPLNAVLRREK